MDSTSPSGSQAISSLLVTIPQVCARLQVGHSQLIWPKDFIACIRGLVAHLISYSLGPMQYMVNTAGKDKLQQGCLCSHAIIQGWRQRRRVTQQENCALQVIIQCPNLEKLDTQGCIGLQTLMLWTDKLTELDITDAKVGHIQSAYLRYSVRRAFACFHRRDVKWNSAQWDVNPS